MAMKRARRCSLASVVPRICLLLLLTTTTTTTTLLLLGAAGVHAYVVLPRPPSALPGSLRRCRASAFLRPPMRTSARAIRRPNPASTLPPPPPRYAPIPVPLRHRCGGRDGAPLRSQWRSLSSPLASLSSPDWVRESSNAIWHSDAEGRTNDDEEEELVLEDDGVTFRRADPEIDADDSSFDAVYSASGPAALKAREHSIAQCTIPEICDEYGFCESYVGELFMHAGCRAPLDTERPVGDFMTGEQVHAVLVALTSFDPASVNEEYYQGGIDNLAQDLGVPPEAVERACRNEGVLLPFGRASRLHEDAVGAVRRALELDEVVAARRRDEIEGGGNPAGGDDDEEEEDDEGEGEREGVGVGAAIAGRSQEALEQFALGEFDAP